MVCRNVYEALYSATNFLNNMIIINGKKTAADLRLKLKDEVDNLKIKFNKTPGLTVILVGEDTPSKIYVKNKEKSANEVGLKSEVIKYPDTVEEETVLEKIEELNNDDSVSGILVQLPLPKHIDKQKVIEKIVPSKDVDGFHPENVGWLTIGKHRFIPCTPKGIMKLLDYYEIDLIGKNIVVIGRSNIVGKPIASLLSSRSDKGNSTVTICHSKTSNLSYFTQQADILIAAVGIPKKIKANMVKKSAIIIDVGINRDKNGKIVGDVDIDSVIDKVGAITPVPGGVGPMTIAMLVENTIESAERIL